MKTYLKLLGPCVFIELLIMFALLVGWASVWVLDGPGLSPSP